jgi:hypothetical protein
MYSLEYCTAALQTELYPAAYTSCILKSEQFWTVTYSPAILKFVQFQRVTEQCKLNSWAFFSHGPMLGAKRHGEKNVQPDWDSNPGPSEYRTVALPTKLSGCLHITSIYP